MLGTTAFSHFKRFSLKTILLTLSLALLSACGGSGGGASAPKPNEPKPQPKPQPKPGTTDTTAPIISILNPADGATLGSASNKRPAISVTFSENVQNVNAANVVLKQGTNPVAVTITGSGKAYSIKPNADLASSSSYTLEFKAGITDAAGNALAGVSKNYNTADWVIPTISSLNPADGATLGSASNKRPDISVSFSENVQNVNTTNVVLKQGTNPVAVTITGSGKTYSIKLNADLASSSSYTLEFKAGITDAAGNALAGVSKNYNTADWVIPTISSLNPADGATLGSASNKRPAISVSFSENVQNVNTTNVVLKQGTNPVAVTITGSGKAYSIKLNDDLASSSSYTLEFKSGITDAAGNALAAVSKSYTTGDLLAPTVALTPADNATNLSVMPNISLNFSETVTGVNATNVVLSKNNDGSNPVALTASGSGSSYTFTPSAKLDYGTEYFIVIKAANIKDAANNPLGSANQVTRFTTHKQKLSFSAWVGSANTLLDINGSLSSSSELYSYRGSNYNDCLITNISGCTNGQTLVNNGSSTVNITNTAHTLTQNAFYRLKEGNFISTGSSENTARFSKRYSHQTVWFKNKFWVIGGYDGTQKNDIWSSTDGVKWTQETANAAFSTRQNHQVVAANIDGTEKLWLIGGRAGSGGTKNDVWSSADGVTWTQVLAHTSSPGANQFSARDYHQVVVANIGGTEKLWLIGGDDGSRKNDVWSSADGVTWTQVLAHTSSPGVNQFSARNYHKVVAANIDGTEKLWLIGGIAVTVHGVSSSKNDVWSSADGVNWTQVLANATSPGANQFSLTISQLVVANIGGTEKLWLIGGEDGSGRKNDVWSSSNGSTWSKSSINGTHFSARYNHQAVVSNIDGSDKLYLIGGHTGINAYENDVWRSADGSNWRKAYLGEITRP